MCLFLYFSLRTLKTNSNHSNKSLFLSFLSHDENDVMLEDTCFFFMN